MKTGRRPPFQRRMNAVYRHHLFRWASGSGILLKSRSAPGRMVSRQIIQGPVPEQPPRRGDPDQLVCLQFPPRSFLWFLRLMVLGHMPLSRRRFNARHNSPGGGFSCRPGGTLSLAEAG